jgi:hypothetical protein
MFSSSLMSLMSLLAFEAFTQFLDPDWWSLCTKVASKAEIKDLTPAAKWGIIGVGG